MFAFWINYITNGGKKDVRTMSVITMATTYLLCLLFCMMHWLCFRKDRSITKKKSINKGKKKKQTQCPQCIKNNDAIYETMNMPTVTIDVYLTTLGNVCTSIMVNMVFKMKQK